METEQQTTVDAIVFSNYPDDMHREEFDPKLEQLGIRILNTYKPDRVSGELANVEQADVIIRFIGFMSHSQDEAIKKKARQYGKPIVVLQRQSSGWQRTFEPIMAAKRRGACTAPTSPPSSRPTSDPLGPDVKKMLNTFMALTKTGVSEDEILQALQAMPPIEGFDCDNLGLVEAFVEQQVERAPDEFRQWWRQHQKALLEPSTVEPTEGELAEVESTERVDGPAGVSSVTIEVDADIVNMCRQVLQFIRQRTLEGTGVFGRIQAIKELHLDKRRASRVFEALLVNRLIESPLERRGPGILKPTLWARSAPATTLAPAFVAPPRNVLPSTSSSLEQQLDDVKALEALYDEEVRRLRADVTRLEHEVAKHESSLKRTLASYNEVAVARAADVQRHRREMGERDKEIARLKALQDRLTREGPGKLLAEAQLEVAALHTTIEGLRVALQKQQATEERVRLLEADLAKARTTEQELRTAVSAARAEVKEAQRVVEQRDATVKQLRDVEAEMRGKVALMQDHLHAAESTKAELAKVKSELLAAQTTASEAQRALEVAVTTAKAAMESAKEAESRASSVPPEMAEKWQNEIAAANVARTNAEASVVRLRKELTTAQNEVKALQLDVEQARASAEAARVNARASKSVADRTSELESALTAARSAANSAMAEVTKARSETERVKADVVAAKAEAKRARDEMEAARTEMVRAQALARANKAEAEAARSNASKAPPAPSPAPSMGPLDKIGAAFKSLYELGAMTRPEIAEKLVSRLLDEK